MKNMKKFFGAFMLVAAFSTGAFSQNVEADMTARANVLNALTITMDQEVDFKMISATTPGSGIVRLFPNGTGGTFTGQGATTGKLTIQGSNETQILISYPAGTTLTSGANELLYHAHVYGSTIEGPQSSGTELTAMGVEGIDVNRTTNADGYFYLFVGGALGGVTLGTPGSLHNQAIGEYTGSVTFEVRYN